MVLWPNFEENSGKFAIIDLSSLRVNKGLMEYGKFCIWCMLWPPMDDEVIWCEMYAQQIIHLKLMDVHGE